MSDESTGSDLPDLGQALRDLGKAMRGVGHTIAIQTALADLLLGEDDKAREHLSRVPVEKLAEIRAAAAALSAMADEQIRAST